MKRSISKDLPKPKSFNVLNVQFLVFSHISPCDPAIPRFLFKIRSASMPVESRPYAASFVKMVCIASFDVRTTVRICTKNDFLSRIANWVDKFCIYQFFWSPSLTSKFLHISPPRCPSPIISYPKRSPNRANFPILAARRDLMDKNYIPHKKISIPNFNKFAKIYKPGGSRDFSFFSI